MRLKLLLINNKICLKLDFRNCQKRIKKDLDIVDLYKILNEDSSELLGNKL